MPSFIDSLIVELGLDTTKFAKGGAQADDTMKKTKENVRRSGADIEDSARKSTQSLQKLQGQVLLLFSAFTAGKGLKDFVQGLVQGNAALGRTAYTLDTTVQKLGTWVNAGEMVGATSQDIIGSFQSLTSQMQQFTLTGESTLLPYLRALGITATNADGSMKDMGETLMEVHKRFQGMDPARAAEIGRGMGLTPGMINLLLQKGDALERMLAMGKKYAPSPADVKAATELAQAWNQMGMSSSAMGRRFLTDVTPALLGLMKALTALGDWLAEHPVVLTIVLGALTAAVLALSTALTVGLGASAFSAVITGFRLMGGLLPGLLLGMAQLFQAVPAVSGVFLEGAVATSTFGGALWSLLGPVALVAAAIAGIVYEVHQLITDMDTAGRHAARLQYEHDRAKAPRGDWRRDPLNATYREDGHYERVNGKAVFVKNAANGASPAGSSASDRAINSVLQNEDRGLKGTVTTDTGGITKYGIAAKSHPGVDIANLTLDQARAIYKKEYWDAIGGDSLSANIQQTALDAAINQGVGNAKKWLAASGGDPEKFNALRGQHYRELAQMNPEKYGRYLPGWLNRLGSMQASASIPYAGAPQRALGSTLRLAGGNSSSSEVHIGEINVNVPSGDPKVIAGGIKDAINRNSFAQQGNFGQS